MRCSYPQVTANRSSVKPYRKSLGLIGPPQPTAVQEHPLGDGALEHLEKWGYLGEGDSFGELVLRDETLRRLEEAICLDHCDNVGFPPNRDARTELPAAPVPGTPDREHPLWDRELDG
jgi:hypothetical protein